MTFYDDGSAYPTKLPRLTLRLPRPLRWVRVGTGKGARG